MSPGPRPKEGAVQVLICDDHLLLAELLGKVLTSHGHRVVVTIDPEKAVETAANHGIDVCLMDLGFPAQMYPDGPVPSIDAIRRLHEAGIRVVVLSGSSNEKLRQAALDAGASDVLLKGEPIDAVIDAVEQANGRRRRMPLVRTPTRGAQGWSRASLADFLTERERAVLEGLVHGESTTALAARLGVRPGTARTHVQNLLGKLCVHTRLEAVSLAVEHHLVDLPEDHV
jgi:two-component system nitrate/nitrite response regulator NarL